MSVNIPQHILFPLYPNGSQVRYRGGYTLENGALVRQSDAVSFSGTLAGSPFGLDATTPGALRKIPTPATAPVIPALYEQATRLLSVSNLKLSDLLAQPSFRISGLGSGSGLGLKVTTDGAGGVDTVALRPSGRALIPALSPFDPNFSGPARVDITTGSIPKIPPETIPLSSSSTFHPPGLSDRSATVFNPVVFDASGGIPAQSPIERLFQPAFRADALEESPEDGDIAAFLQGADRLEDSERNETLVFGYEAFMGDEEARRIAVNRAKLDVTTGDAFRRDVATLVTAHRMEARHPDLMQSSELDKRLSVLHFLSASGRVAGASGGESFSPGMADASDRKSQGGYLPFHGNAQGGFSGSGNPFRESGGFPGQGGNGQQRRRLPVFMA